MGTNAIGQAIRQLREERGLTVRDLAEKLAAAGHVLSFAAISAKERGLISIKPPERRIFAEVMGETLEQFDKRWRATKIDQSIGDDSGDRGIPVINWAPAGLVVDYTEHGCDSGQGFAYIDRGGIKDEHAFAVVVVGDSMAPTIMQDDYLIFSPLNVPNPQAKLDAGKVVFVRIGPDNKRPGCFIGRFAGKDGDGLKFTKDNPKHKGLTVPMVDIERIAVAIERRTRL